MKTEIKKIDGNADGSKTPKTAIDKIALRTGEGCGAIMKNGPHSGEELQIARKMVQSLVLSKKDGVAAQVAKEAGLEAEMKEIAGRIIDQLEKDGKHVAIVGIAREYGLEEKMKQAARIVTRKLMEETQELAQDMSVGHTDPVILAGLFYFYNMLNKFSRISVFSKEFGIGKEMGGLARKLVETSVLNDMTNATNYLAPCEMISRGECLKNAYGRGAHGLGLDEKEIYSILDSVFEKEKGRIFEYEAKDATLQFYRIPPD